MKHLKSFLITLLFACTAHASDQVLSPINFSGGVDYSHVCTEIDDSRSCDSSNMVNNKLGASLKRDGSDRYIDQSISTNPIASLYRVSVSTGNKTISALIVTTWDKILYSTSTTGSVWTTIYSGLATHNQRFSFATINGKVIMTGNALTDPVLQFDVVKASMSPLLTNDGSSVTVMIRAKYVYNANNYLLLGNVMDIKDTALDSGATYYSNRVYYSLYLQQSSFTVSRYWDVGANNGEVLTGFTQKQGKIECYTQGSIWEVTYTKLNLPSFGGDIQVYPIVTGFGCIAPYSLVDLGIYDVFLSREGVLIWDGSRKTRLNTEDEKKEISALIKPTIERIIKSGDYGNAQAVYYPKKQWYVFSFSDPDKFPKGKNNTVYVCDMNTYEWFPFRNWLSDSLGVLNGVGDKGDLIYGDSMDGYVYYADSDDAPDDARREISVDNMDSTSTWVSASTDTVHFVEGTAACRIQLSDAVLTSSITKVAIINLSEWYDKTPATFADKIQFKVYVSSRQNISSLRVDLQVGEVDTAFDQYFTSVTVSSAALTGGNTAWTTLEIQLSSFPIPSSWLDLDLELVPFANTLTYYGLRFHAVGIGDSELTIDDVRFVGERNAPLNAFRLTKQFNFSSKNAKDFRQVILTHDTGRSSGFNIDVFSQFGALVNTINVGNDIPKEIFVCGFEGQNGITKLSSIDWKVLDSTSVSTPTEKDIFCGYADNKYLYFADRSHDTLYSVDRSSMTRAIRSFGETGSGTTNFYLTHAITGDDSNLYVIDNMNNRVQSLNKNTFGVRKTFGVLGNGATNFHNPTGITSDESNVWIGNDGNFAITKLSKSTFGYVSQISLPINAIGETTLACDNAYLYDAYITIVNTSLLYQNISLEKRNKGDGSLVNRVTIYPNDTVAISSYSLMGDITLLGQYIYIPFTNDIALNDDFYIQKRLKSDFTLVEEYHSKNRLFSVIGDGQSYLPDIKSEKIPLQSQFGEYIQLRYYENELNNNFKLLNQAFVVDVVDYQE